MNILSRKGISQQNEIHTKKKSSAALRKLLSSKFSLYLTRSHASEISKKMISDHEFDYECMKKLVKAEVECQDKSFRENLMSRRRKSSRKFQAKKKPSEEKEKYYSLSKSLEHKNMNKNNFEKMIDEFFKTFFLKFYIKLNEKSLDFTKTTLNEIYFSKIKNFIKYENEIQQLNILKLHEGIFLIKF
jgi:hypothetical protein